MNQRTHDHFTPRGTLSREQLMAYAEGRLDPAVAHEVERHLEEDPLLREAMEGLQLPGAIAGLGSLSTYAPRAGASPWINWSVSVMLVAAVGTAVYMAIPEGSERNDTPLVVETMATIEPADQPVAEATLDSLEVAASVELPESLHIGHALTDRHSIAQVHTTTNTSPVPIEREQVQPVEPKAIPRVVSEVKPQTKPAGPRRPSLQLVYLHDLKLLHPKELYGYSPDIDRLSSGVDARFATADEQALAQALERRIAYLSFMDEALAKFVQNDHKGCLEELTFVLNQYPEDVNALFYAGLCSYNLGLNKRAERYLDRAARHAFNVFNEEAEWYHALAMERSGKKESARSEFERIARSASFYAERAQAKLIK
ncbi:MAG TPA: hypothetical protein PLR96_02920 [Flavobacteriales bacterium]|nr:hypothetical protein [Flavobacteriales bacterium]